MGLSPTAEQQTHKTVVFVSLRVKKAIVRETAASGGELFSCPFCDAGFYFFFFLRAYTICIDRSRITLLRMDRRTSERIKSIIKKCNCFNSNSKSHDHANKNNMNQNSNNNKSCQVISKLLLPEDLMIYIFTLVPLNCLIKSAKYVCKSWATTIRSSHFAEVFERQRRSKPGLYVENHMSKSSSYFLEFKDNVNDQFERIELGIPPSMGLVIGTCDGILLLWNGSKQTFVVNPVIKCWLRIPPFPSSLLYLPRCCRCTITRVPRTAKFKLFHVNVLEVSGVVWYVCYVLKIGKDNSWKEIARKESPPNMDIYLQRQRLCSGGNDLYWITPKEVIVMDVDREIILQEYPLHHLSTVGSYLLIGNRLSCILYYINETYQFELFYFDSGKWSLYYKTEPIDIVAACGHEHNIWSVIFRLWINDHIIFRVSLPTSQTENLSPIIPCIENIHFCYNVKTKQLTKIEDIEVGNSEVWLHTNSLVTLPSSPA